MGDMMKSIIQDLEDKKCFICGSYNWIELHHIFGGANRKKSEKYGLVVYLCHDCHNEAPNGVHHNAERMRILRSYAQKKAMKYYGWTTKEFIKLFGKNYL